MPFINHQSKSSKTISNQFRISKSFQNSWKSIVGAEANAFFNDPNQIKAQNFYSNFFLLLSSKFF